jgi:RsmE family RNA methyltransferase
VNLILFEATELDGDLLWLADRRAEHVLSVIGPALGDTLRVGVIGGPTGLGTVVNLATSAVRLQVRLEGAAPATPPVSLVLAVPRPKVLRRVLRTVGALGVARLDLVNSWRVDKSYFQSPVLRPEVLRRHLLEGAEQGATTWLPPVRVHPRLMPYLDDRLPGLPTAKWLLCHPGAPVLLEQGAPSHGGPMLVAVGPEGGWITREVETFTARGFQVVDLGLPVLDVASAVAALLAQLGLLGRLPPPP